MEAALFAVIGIAGIASGYQSFNNAVNAQHALQTVAWFICWAGLTAIGAFGLFASLVSVA